METDMRERHPTPPPIQENFHGESTLAIHAGEHKNRPQVYDSITTPIVSTSTYWFKDTQQVVDFNEGRYNTHEYGRYGNPTVRALEQKLAIIEAPDRTDIDCLFSSSGMASVTNMILGLIDRNSHLVITSDCYRRTRQFIEEFLPKMGVTFSIIEPENLESLQKIVSEKKSCLYFSETPTNPYCRCVDIEKIVKICHPHGTIVAIDSTFATPINFQPLSFGADLVLHSGTKYLGGHNDTMSGAIVGKKELITKVKKMQNILGPVLDPHAAYFVIRGMKTLQLRLQKGSSSALQIANFLEKHDFIEKVWYPGLKSHPDHEIAKKYFKNGFGGVLSFEIKGDFTTTAKFIDSLKIPYIAPSFGGVESLAEQPACMSYWNLTREQRYKVGIKDNLVRYSCGIEDTEDLISDIKQALEKARKKSNL